MTTGDFIASRSAAERIVAVPATQIVDSRIAFERVISAGPVQIVVAAVADELIVSAQAVEKIVARVTNQRIRALGAGQPLLIGQARLKKLLLREDSSIGEGIAHRLRQRAVAQGDAHALRGGIAARGRREAQEAHCLPIEDLLRQINFLGCETVAELHDDVPQIVPDVVLLVEDISVVAFAAQQNVTARAAFEHVVARLAEQIVVAVASLQRVVALAALEFVGASAPVQGVVALQAEHDVVAAQPADAIGDRGPDQHGGLADLPVVVALSAVDVETLGEDVLVGHHRSVREADLAHHGSSPRVKRVEALEVDRVVHRVRVAGVGETEVDHQAAQAKLHMLLLDTVI